MTAKDDAERPCVYEEAMEMLIGSVIIYIFSEMRNMVREGTLQGVTMKDLEPPLSAGKTLDIIQTNKEALAERAVDHEYLESRLQTLRNVRMSQQQKQQQQQQQQQQQEPTAGPSALFNLLFSKFSNSTKEVVEEVPLQDQIILTKFMDERADKEIVHAVVLNPTRKRVTIVFRGSVTQKDFLQDAKCAQKKVENPVLSLLTKDDSSMPATINIHTGFYEYLFFEDKASGKTRLEIILEDAKEQLQLHPGFSLYCTGHSLGGALSTLCGFYAACDEELMNLSANHRVVVYSIASPFCGNWKFRRAFQELERTRRLQHLRIANLEDMVTLLPFAVPKATIMSPALSLVKGAGNLYKHVGIKLQIKSKEEGDKNVVVHSIAYPKEQHCEDDEEYAQELNDAMQAGKSLIKAFYYLCKNDFETVEKYHSCDEYEERLEACEAGLTNKTLDDLYADERIVGKLFSTDFQPSLMASGASRALKAFSVLRRSSSKKNDKVEEEEQLTLTEAALA